MRRPRVVAHRGSSATHADNSAAAFAAALAEGADAIECDVQASRDGVLVVRHDLTLGDRLVADLSWAAIARVEPQAMRLDELLSWAAAARIDLLVEVKEPVVTADVARMIAASRWAERCVLGSFHGPALGLAKTVAPTLRTSFMMGSVAAADELVALAAACRTDGVHLCWESRAARPHRLVDRVLIEHLRRAGLTITLWHEERPDELRALCALEPDAICTNTPAALRRIVDERCAAGSKARAATQEETP